MKVMLRSAGYAMCISIACLFLSFSPLHAEAPKLANGEWAPYLGKNLPHGGSASHIVSAAFKEAGVDVDYVWYGDAWNRAYNLAIKGKEVQGSLGWSYEAKREKDFYFSSDIIIPGNKEGFWYLKEKGFDWNDIKDLNGLKVGGVVGYSYGGKIDRAEKDGLIKLQLISDESTNFKKLLANRIDIFIAGEDTGKDMLKKNFTPEQAAKLAFHPKPLRIAGYHVILSKAVPGNDTLMKKFDEGLKKLKADGRYDQIYKDMEAGKYN